MQKDLLSWMKTDDSFFLAVLKKRIYDVSQNGIHLHSSSGDMNDPA